MKKRKTIQEMLARQGIILEKIILANEMKIIAKPERYATEFSIHLYAPSGGWFKFKTMSEKEMLGMVKNIKEFTELLK